MARNVSLMVIVLLVIIAVVLGLLLFQQLNGGLFNTRSNITVILDSIQEMSVLTTTRYNFSSLVTSEREMPGILSGLYGERLVLVAVGSVVAGVDLSGMSEDDLQTEGETMRLRLPPAQLQDCFLDEPASYVVSRDTGIFARSAPELDGTARRYAVQQFRDAALESGILNDAATQAQAAIEEFVRLLDMRGVTTVRIEATPPQADAPLPATCQ